jgi:hypothetical protein
MNADRLFEMLIFDGARGVDLGFCYTGGKPTKIASLQLEYYPTPKD